MALEILGKKLAKKAAEGALESVAKKSRKPVEVAARKELAPVLERARPFTDEELRAFAERMAPQINNEFYRPNPKVSQNPVGMSHKRWKAEQELKHTIVPTREVAVPIPYDPAKWEGHVLASIAGDPTIGDKTIVDINGRKLISPSKQEAGPLYGLGEPTDAWASTEDAAKAIQGRIIDTSERYGAPVLGVYTKMGPGSYNFAVHVEDALLKNIVSNIDNMTDHQIKAFNKLIRNHTPDFAGIENPDLALEQLRSDRDLREKFFDVATKQENVKTLGIPNGLDVVHAALEPELRYLETGVTGHSVVQMDPSKKILLPAEHETYTHRIPRLEDTEVMQSAAPIPYQLQYPDQMLAISKNPDQAPRPFGTISMGGASQINDAQHVDQISKYLEYIKKLTGKKKGGAIYKAAKEILSKDKKFAKGGAVEDDIDYITSDPVAYLQNEIKPIDTKITSSEEFSRRIGKPIPALNPAIAMIRKGINPVIEALREDVEKIKPRAAIDVPINAVSEILGAPVDIANELRDPITPIRSDIVSTMKDYKLAPSEALPGSSKSFKKATTDIGLTSGEDYPALQFAAGMIGVPEVKAIGAAAKAGVKGYGNLVKEAIGRDAVPFLRAKDFQMNILPERGVNLGVDFTRPSEDTILGHKMESMPGSQWYSWLQSNAPKSAKKELETSGTMNWLKDSKEKVSKNDIINHLRENEPNLRSRTYSEYSDSPYEVYGGGDDGYHVVNTSVSDKPISSHETQGEAYWALNELESELYPKPAYSKWTLPGGDNYREIVIQDKSNQAMLDKNSPKVIEEAIKSYGEEALPKLSQSQWDTVIKRINQKFESSHYPEATNPIAHLRVNHRKDAEGNPTLFIEELQSDWGQKGKKHGFAKQETLPNIDAEELLVKYDDKLNVDQRNWLNRFVGRWDAIMDDINRGAKPDSAIDPLHQEYNNWIKNQKIGIEPGPYVQDTKDWTALALKQAIKEAIDNGKTQVAWTNGAQQAERYDLSKKLSSVSLHPQGDGKTFGLNAYDHSGKRVIQERVTEDNLDDYIGKDLANKLLAVKTHTEKPFTQAEHRLLDHYMEVGKKNLSEDEIKDFDRLIDQANKNKQANVRRLEGLDIKVGGEGMHGYYDQILPQVANDVIKQLGGKHKVKPINMNIKEELTDKIGSPNARSYFTVDGTSIVDPTKDITFGIPLDANKIESYWIKQGVPESTVKKALQEYYKDVEAARKTIPTQMGFEITPEMIKRIKEKGIPKFKKGGVIDLNKDYKLENLRRRYG